MNTWSIAFLTIALAAAALALTGISGMAFAMAWVICLLALSLAFAQYWLNRNRAGE